jgi:hypothetical protein
MGWVYIHGRLLAPARTIDAPRINMDSGSTSHAVASALGHESFKTTAESYAKREAVAGAQQKRRVACGDRYLEDAIVSRVRETSEVSAIGFETIHFSTLGASL